MLKRIAIIAFFVLSFSSCDGSPSEIQYYRWETLPIGVAVQNDYERTVLTRYNDFFEYTVFVEDELGIKIEYLSADNTRMDPGTKGRAFTFIRYGQIKEAHILMRQTLLDDSTDPEERDAIFAHELGHCLGHKGHDGTGLMRSSPDYRRGLENLFSGEFSDWMNSQYPEIDDSNLNPSREDVSDEF